MTNLKKLCPAQDCVDGILSMGVSLPNKESESGEYALKIITSNRKSFWADPKSLTEHGFHSAHPAQSDSECRWSSDSIDAFLQGTGQPISLNEASRLIEGILSIYISFQDERYSQLLSLWILGTYMHQAFPAYPYIHLSGPTGSGKTKIAQIVQQLGFNGMLSANMSPAFIFRAVEAFRPTICLDEAENLENSRDEHSQAVIQLLNSGYKNGSKVGRMEQKGKCAEFKVIQMDCYSPKLLAGIAGINSVLAARCIQVPTMMGVEASICNKQIDISDSAWQEARDAIYPAVLDNFGSVQEAKRTLSDTSIVGRDWELWYPILALAKAVSKNDEVYQSMRQLALEMIEQRKELKMETSEDIHFLLALERLTKAKPHYAGYTTRDVIEAVQDFYHTEYGHQYKKPYLDLGRWVGTRLRQLRVVTGPAINRSVQGDKSKRYQFDNDTVRLRLREHGVEIGNDATVIEQAENNAAGYQETTETDVERVQRIFKGEIVS